MIVGLSDLRMGKKLGVGPKAETWNQSGVSLKLPSVTPSPRTREKTHQMSRGWISLKLTWLGLTLNSYVRGGSGHTSLYQWIFTL